LAGIRGELLEITATLELGSATEINFNLRGIPLIYDVKNEELSCLDKQATLKPVNGKISLRIFVDRTTVDIFGPASRLYMPMSVLIPAENTSLNLKVSGGEARIDSMTVYELRSAWE
jgi:sucrose-6-phosphate hydrolase SacC (GH32 family)